ncbi:Na/Pi cotransporter family protein [Alkalihalophilus lindianensis]|uniref:Na/Pi cotransporter family protein n=1 Tax=Alkalihalophilus lindianensis TaxID=1630542 RepID=A0ABU3XEL3_9BACI|nr:Na/Pi cotransporter family protein [Alkalihalophilus lindianensis]MDV2686329.1 Na/Pi cotransporter family protein [Alkalihalophilus lindianensis]
MIMTQSLLSFLGGLGLFLYGMSRLSKGLQKAAINKLRLQMGRVVKNRLKALVVGLFFTFFLQSSTVMSIIAVGLVSHSIITFVQALGVILGSAIGTTITVQVLAFNISQFSPLFIFLGVILLVFVSTDRVKPAGEMLLGFGMVLFGISYLSQAVLPLTNEPIVTELLLYLANQPLLLFLVSVLLTSALHSSVAMIIVGISFYSAGAMGYEEVIWLVLGANLGATVPVLVASFSVSLEGRKVALAYLVMKLSIVIVVGVVLMVFPVISNHIPGGSERQIANFHTTFNLFLAICWLPFLFFLAKAMNQLLPNKEKDQVVHISEQYLPIPDEALIQTEREVLKLSRFIQAEMIAPIPAIIERGIAHQEIERREQYIDQAYMIIQQYLLKIAQQDLSKEQSDQEVKLLYMLNDLEQIGDIVLQISANIEKLKSQQIELVKEDAERLKQFIPTIIETLQQAIVACEEGNNQLVRKLMREQGALNEKERDFRFDHFNTLLQQNEYNPTSSAIYLDLVNQLMRLHHATLNISRTVLGII